MTNTTNTDEHVHESENEYGEKTIIDRATYGIAIKQDTISGRETVRLHANDDRDALESLRDEIDEMLAEHGGGD